MAWRDRDPDEYVTPNGAPPWCMGDDSAAGSAATGVPTKLAPRKPELAMLGPSGGVCDIGGDRDAAPKRGDAL
jgi:hypothetical protein